MASEEKVEVERWARAEPFSPQSPKQVLAYLANKQYKIPRHRTSKKATSNDESLAELNRQHDDPVLDGIVECRHLNKAISYLTDKHVHKDGKLHPLYQVIPRSGRLSSTRPSVMNLPQGKGNEIMEEAAATIRSAIIPSSGWHLGEFDWRAVEPTLTGFFAEDPSYTRMAKLGSHAFVTSMYLGWDVSADDPDEKLIPLFLKAKEEHPVEYKLCKIGNMGFNYDQGVYNMARSLKSDVATARRIRGAIEKAYPKVAKWKHDTKLRAHSEGKLVTPFGFSLSFFNVFDKRDGKLVPGREASECLAFLPQSTGASMLREVLVDLGGHEWEGERFRLLVPTHDSILFEYDPAHEQEVLELVKRSMERKWVELGGLVVETECKTGATAASLKVRSV